MANLETRIKRTEDVIYQRLKHANPNRSVFVEGCIYLENIIDILISERFSIYPEDGGVKNFNHKRFCKVKKNFKNGELYKSKFYTKIELLEHLRIISEEERIKLHEILNDRNDASHAMDMQITKKVTIQFKRNTKEINKQRPIQKLIVTDDDVEQYMKKCAKWYAYLLFKGISKEHLKIG